MLQLKILETSGGKFFGFRRRLRLRAELLAEPGDSIPLTAVVGSMLEASPELTLQSPRLETREEQGRRYYLLRDERGRPMETLKESGARHAQPENRVREEESFYSDGSFFTLPDQLEDFPADPADLPSSEFAYGVNTRFQEFTSRGDILHTLRPWATANLQEVLPQLTPSAILSAVPLRIEQVRMGFERYKKRFLGAMLGIIPSIESRFYFEITGEKIYLLLEQENVPSSQQLPLEDCGMLDGLERALAGAGLFPDLRRQLTDRLAHGRIRGAG